MIARLSARIRSLAGDDLVQKMAGGAISALVIKTSSAGLTFLMFLLLARAMPDAEYGHFASGFSLALFLALAATLGQPKLVLRFLSRYLGADDAPHARAVNRFALRRVTAGALLMALACAGIAGGVRWFGHADDAGLWIAVGLLTFFYALSEYYGHLLQALGKVVAALAPRDGLWRGAIVVMAGAALLRGVTLRAQPALFFCAAILALAILIQNRIAGRVLGGPDSDRSAGGAISDGDAVVEWKKATPGLALLAVMGEAFPNLFVVATGLLLSAVDAGHFFAAMKTATLLALPLMATNMITAPMISRHYHKHETGQLQSVCRMAISLAVPVTLIGLAILLFFGPLILGWFGPGFRAAYPALLVIAIGRLVNALSGPTALLMMMTGHERRFLVFLTVSNLAGFAALAVLAPAFGITGAAIGVTVAQTAWNLAVWFWARRVLRIDPTALAMVRKFHPAPAD